MTTPHALKRAESFIFAGELADAHETLTTYLDDLALSADERDTALRTRAAVRMHMGQMMDARADLDALSVHYDADDFQRSLIAEREGDLNAAISAAMTAWQSHNRYYWRDEREVRRFIDRTFERIIRLLIAAGRTIQADVLLSPSQYQTLGWLHMRADIAADDGRHDDALTYYTSAWRDLDARLDAADPLVRNQRGALQLKRARCLRILKRPADASAALDVAAADMDDPAVGFERGLLHFDLQPDDLDGAIALCRAALESASPAVVAALRESLADARYTTLAARL
ncbi:MAG: hypothetical protein SGI73_21430 [Chloroflexota bacterium]|nr:hypothetical protein [Chloroflexota bacterium]